jgi:PAS domain S-box-containing protein
LRALVYRCRRNELCVEGSAWDLAIGGAPHRVSFVVSRLDPQRGDQILVSFRALRVDRPQAAPAAARSSDHDLIIAELEKELARTRAHLNVVVEELETSNEELQSLNEELQSANEELQSSNEELQTSNEELQSTNEELLTVNEEIQIKSSELETLAHDLNNVKESIFFPLFVVDRAMRITCFNRACGAVAALSHVEIGKSLHEVGWHIDVPHVFERIAEVLASGTAWSQIVTAGDDRVYNFHIMPYRAARQAIDGVLMLYEDITALHRARQAIDRHLEDLRLLGNATANGVLAVDRAGIIGFANPAADALFGYAEGELVGMQVEHLVPEALAGAHVGFREKAAIDDSSVHLMGPSRNVQGRHRDGTLFPIDVQLRQSRSGLSSDVVASIFDLRPRMALERQLREAKEAAEAANEAKSSFLAAMSHEIRTPMNVVFGMLELLARSDIGQQQRAYLQQAEIATRSLRHVIDDILDFSKVEADRLDLELVPFNLAELVHALAGQMAMTAGDRDIVLRVDLDPAIAPTLLGDPLRLHQVLLNLVSNAFKFTSHGSIVLSVRQMACAGPMAQIEFAVCDTGIGIAKDSLDAIFEGFTQAESSTTRRFGGTGLGLAIARRLVELMQGKLAVESSLGQGSRFHFTIDLPVVADLPPVSSPDTAGFMLAPVPLRLIGTHVLLVEDFPLNQTLMLALLRAEGADVAIAANGADAIAMVEHGPRAFDIVLMDVQMPVMDGFDAARALRRIERGADLPILAITANALPADREKCLAAGMDDYIAKPIVLDDLVAKIGALLRPVAPVTA